MDLLEARIRRDNSRGPKISDMMLPHSPAPVNLALAVSARIIRMREATPLD
uniref:Uncharacterized protein n=1 Tax=Peronospora matthiolae TaxID=2874970 RepID=A0AAV1TQI9_9STRA